jgi:HEAT repeat protein
MGLFDAMFGGGTKLELFLDTTTASPGGVVGGRVVLTGGQKPLRLTDLSVRLMFVSVTTRPGESLPNIDAREVARQVVAANGNVPPMAPQTFAFRVTVPSDLPPSAHNISFQVIAVADIPGVKDPSASVDLKVVVASKDANRRLPYEAVMERFPDLQSNDEEAIVEALRQLFVACYSEGGQLLEIEPVVLRHLHNGSARVRRAALEAWANLVDNRVQPHHLQTLYQVANTPGLDDETFEQVIIAATKFAEEGALPLVQALAQDPRSDVRKRVAQNLRFNAAEKFNGKRELLVTLAQDAAPEVRKAAVSALSGYNDDQQIAYWVAGISDSDPSADVRAECMSTLALAHYHGMLDLTLAVYEKHVQSPDADVRGEIARNLQYQPAPAFQRIWGIAQRLAADPDEDVRRALAFGFCNMQKLPQLLPIAQHMATNDPSPEVRREALTGMSGLLQPAQAAALYAPLVAQATTEQDLWPIVSGLRQHSDNKDVKRLLSQIGQCPFPSVADAARDALS